MKGRYNMKTRTLGQKLQSSKLWIALSGVVLGAVLYLGGDPDTIRTIAGVTVQVLSIISYIITEGKIDAEAVAHTILITGEAIEAIMGDYEDEAEQTLE